MAGTAQRRKSPKWKRDLWPVCDHKLAGFQHFDTSKERKTADRRGKKNAGNKSAEESGMGLYNLKHPYFCFKTIYEKI